MSDAVLTSLFCAAVFYVLLYCMEDTKRTPPPFR
jgi:hypothetical protein